MRELCLITAKPVLYVANVAEDDLDGNHPSIARLREHAAAEGAEFVIICGKIEAEIAELPNCRTMRKVLSLRNSVSMSRGSTA